MEKQGIVNLNVNTSSKTPKVETKIRFSSLDVNSAKLIFNVTKDGAPLPLSTAKGILDLRMMDGSTFDELPVKITDAAKGVMEYSLTTEQLKHTGTAQAELSVTYENGQGMSISKFEFKIDKALRDQDVAVKAEHYIAELKDIAEVVNAKAQEVTANLDKIEVDFEERTAAIEEQLDSLDENVGQSTVLQVDAAKTDTTGQKHADIDSRIKAEVGKINTKQGELTAALADTSRDLIRLRTFSGEKFPVYISHNGLNYIAPINSLPAYELAAETGYRYFEVDVRTTSDNVWMCFHDDDIAAMTDGTGLFKDKTYEQAKALNIDTFLTTYPGTKIPTLEEFLDFCDKWNGVPIIEIKVYNNDSNLKELVDILTRRGYLNDCMVVAFGMGTMTKVRNISKEIPLCLLSNTATQADIDNAKLINSDYLSIQKSAITKEFCTLAHNQGFKIGAWTCDSEQEARQLTKIGVDVITTNSLPPRGL